LRCHRIRHAAIRNSFWSEGVVAESWVYCGLHLIRGILDVDSTYLASSDIDPDRPYRRGFSF